ncbi:hypothetical protein NHP190003_12100 [Helicobacter sp. NHP19-003]|uniref:Uncharacterized protein n=1 Tax=Helicobacter gastrocanis TaxID=2849641 RepID=A0ABM7SIM0_9HELI|nr:hypothetical protein NHP190003_12100 [Helicobacter sp. NHP19-003]
MTRAESSNGNVAGQLGDSNIPNPFLMNGQPNSLGANANSLPSQSTVNAKDHLANSVNVDGLPKP